MIIMCVSDPQSILLDELTEEGAFFIGSGRMETEAADHDDIEQGDTKGCRAADTQNDSVLLEEILQGIVAAYFWSA